MNDAPKPETATAMFSDGCLTVRLSFPAQDAGAWRTATPGAILGHLGLAVLTEPVAAEPNGTDAAREEC
ncbi:MAG: hypothetical protein WC876_04355 [Candidatus Thermoplasmatota archaeon]|jgi:hypothetical protein